MSQHAKKFDSLAIDNPDDLLFGQTKRPVECGNGIRIGGGQVYPEINFTLPPMKIEAQTWGEVLEHYHNIAEVICSRAVKLRLPGLVVEFEQLPPMTEHPEWGAEITKILKNALNALYKTHGIANALRVTIVDLRDADRPPLLRKGRSWELTRESFEASAQAGADILSIESVGGKEVHDQALLYGDLLGIVVALGSLGARDMAFLWDEIVSIASKYKVVAGGDTACGFSNTAMQLAGKGMIPSVFAALDRAASAPRSLVAYEQGAVGPSKDCAYEGPVIKAITGFPISMEGKSSSCAHFSPLGNIAAASADLWSNESVQNIQLLSGSAPEAYLELLAYDCRLFNTSIQAKESLRLRDWMVESDVGLSVEALMLKPSEVIKISRAIVAESSGYLRTKAAVTAALKSILEYTASERVKIPEMEKQWLERYRNEIENLPEDENVALDHVQGLYGSMFLKESYGL